MVCETEAHRLLRPENARMGIVVRICPALVRTCVRSTPENK